MAFGISGSDTSTNMVGADVVVAWVDNGVANAVDYYLTSRQQVWLCIHTMQVAITSSWLCYSYAFMMACMCITCAAHMLETLWQMYMVVKP